MSACLTIEPRLFTDLMAGLAKRGQGCRESGAFLLTGRDHPEDQLPQPVIGVVFYDDLDPDCLNGGIDFHAVGYTALQSLCRRGGLRVTGDIHTHPAHRTQQSRIDADHPMVARDGHVALIAPRFAAEVTDVSQIGVHVRANGGWTSSYGDRAAEVVLVGARVGGSAPWWRRRLARLSIWHRPQETTMTMSITDTFNRTALLGVQEGTQATVTAALDAHTKTGIVIVATSMPLDLCGQAALCTAVATAVRAFGKVIVIVDGSVELTFGPYRGLTTGEMTEREGAQHANFLDPSAVRADFSVLHLGDAPAAPGDGVRLRASWDGWAASVYPVQPATGPSGEGNVVTAVAAAALGVHEAFGVIRERPGSEVGWRTITLNLWQPGTDVDGPALTHVPAAWWLVGLGHLGQAYAWVLSWLPYAEPARVEIVLQDTQRVVGANHSTGLLTPVDPAPVRKTRLAEAVLEKAGYDVVILDRRLDETSRVRADDCHVALLGVDSLEPRLLISRIGWKLAIDAGLGIGPADFNAAILYRFPARIPSDQVTAWNNDVPQQRRVASAAALTELEQRDPCGSVELAGTAVGAAFVGAVTACLAITQGARAILTDDGSDVINVHLQSGDAFEAPATAGADLPGARLLPL